MPKGRIRRRRQHHLPRRWGDHDLDSGQFWVTWTGSQGLPWEATGFSTGPEPVDVTIDDVIGGLPGTVIGTIGAWQNPPDPDSLDLKLNLYVYCEVEPGLFDLFDFYAEFGAYR